MLGKRGVTIGKPCTCEFFASSVYGHKVIHSDISSDSSGNDSDCVLLYATSGTDPKGEVCQAICPHNPSSSNSECNSSPSVYSGELVMDQFVEEVHHEYSLYTDVPDIDFFRSKLDISATGNEEDVVVLFCDLDETMCDQELAGDLDESFLMYMVVLREFGVTIPFRRFKWMF